MPVLARTAPARSSRSLGKALLDRATPKQLALGRVGAGSVMLVAPRKTAQHLGVDSATSARMSWAVQMLGVRDAALGLGALVALRSDDPRAVRPWLAAGLLSDAVDALAVGSAVARGRLSKGTGGAAVAVAVLAAVAALHALDEDEADR